MDDSTDTAQHCRVQGSIQLLYLSIPAVHRDGVLGQVIGADAEEVCLLRHQVGGQSSSRCFNHHAQCNLRVVLQAFAAQLLLTFLQQTAGCADFLHAGDQRQHNLDVFLLRSRTQQRTQLGLKKRLFAQTVTDGAPTQKRVLLAAHLQIGDLLVSTDIQRADDDLLALHQMGNTAVRFQLFLLIRHSRTVHEQKLGAEQPDSFRSVFQSSLCFHHAADVGIQLVASAGGICGRLVPINRQHRLLTQLLLLELGVVVQRFRIRLGQHLTADKTAHHSAVRNNRRGKIHESCVTEIG